MVEETPDNQSADTLTAHPDGAVRDDPAVPLG